MKTVIALIALMASSLSFAAGGSVELDEHKTDLSDTASLQRGAQTFMNYCMACHSLEYGRYNRVAKDLGIPEELMQENLNFAGKRFGDLMTTAMRKEDSKKWFGATPPDLTLVTRVRGGDGDWLYTYLRSFHEDKTRPYGVNNTAFKDVGMPHVLADLQGLQKLGCAPVSTGYDSLTGTEIMVDSCELAEPKEVLYLAEEGQLSPKEYDNLVYDLVNFLVYMSEPVALERQRLGWWVLLFLFIFLIPVYLLNKEYWKDIH